MSITLATSGSTKADNLRPQASRTWGLQERIPDRRAFLTIPGGKAINILSASLDILAAELGGIHPGKSSSTSCSGVLLLSMNLARNDISTVYPLPWEELNVPPALLAFMPPDRRNCGYVPKSSVIP